MTAAAYPSPDEAGGRNQGSHPEENAGYGAQDENHKVAKNSGSEELRFQHHALCIKYQDLPGEKSPRRFAAKPPRPGRVI